MKPLTKRSKNISKFEYVATEKQFEEYCNKGEMKYWPPLRIEWIKTIRDRLNSNEYPSEIWFENELKKNKIKGYLRNWPIANRFFADFYFPKANIVVEIDGKEHDAKSDRKRDIIFRRFHVCVLRIKRHDQNAMLKIIDKLNNNPRAKFGFKLLRKSVTEADMYNYLPPETKKCEYPDPIKTYGATVLRSNEMVAKYDSKVIIRIR